MCEAAHFAAGKALSLNWREAPCHLGMGMKRYVTVGDKYCLQKVTAPVEYTVRMLMKTFQYRLYPTKGKQRLLTQQLEECRWLWNTLLAERKQAWEEHRQAVDYYEQKAELPGLKADVHPGLK